MLLDVLNDCFERKANMILACSRVCVVVCMCVCGCCSPLTRLALRLPSGKQSNNLPLVVKSMLLDTNDSYSKFCIAGKQYWSRCDLAQRSLIIMCCTRPFVVFNVRSMSLLDLSETW